MRHFVNDRRGSRGGWLTGLLGLVACAPQVAIDDSGDGTGTESATGTTQGPGTLADTSTIPTDDDDDDRGDDDIREDALIEEPAAVPLDILFVIDNSAGMADAQR
ncbi:MAG: hypothetical protein IAG13_17680, partial [Deltaproteobacteria bacterium]|nr:hypothetical protein [Nannocystaceae bacterium]